MHRRILLALALTFASGLALFEITCAKPQGLPPDMTGGCAVGLTSCSNQCVDTTMDGNNCGSCGHSCGANASCTAGTCSCQSGYLSCSGACVNPVSDPNDCGACGNACPSAQVCDHGKCSSSCSTGTTLCSRACVATTSDNANCGGCGIACRTDQVCTNSACACPSGKTDCSGSCVDTTSNGANCGSCGHACGSTQTCIASVCGCPSGQVACANGTCAATQAACSSTGTGGAGGGGGGGAGGSSADGGSVIRTCALVEPANGQIISDFEEGTATVEAPPTPSGKAGAWYTFSDPTTGGTSTNNIVPSGSSDMCNKFALSSNATNHPMYVGFGVTLAADPTDPNNAAKKTAVSAAAWDGVKFSIKSNSGTQPPLWFEFLNAETQPTASSGTGNTMNVDQYNTRGQLLQNVGTTTQTIYVPFGTLIPRFLPAAAATNGCPSGSVCQAPNWNPASEFGFQFSLYPDFTTASAYGVTIDDVQFYKRPTTGAPPDLPAPPNGGGAHPFPRNASVGSCTKPKNADGNFIIGAYNAWKARFVQVSGNTAKVIRPENGNDTVSEGIGYGMLISVMMNDKTLFDQLNAYWKSQPTAGNLMTWCIPSGGGSCSATGGSATDADEDAAFALMEASKQWSGGTYAADAMNIMHAILASDMSGSTYIKGGSNYAANGITNPSYFAPAYYREFAKFDTANTATWNGLASAVYTLLGNISGTSSNGLYAAWCGFSGSTPCGTGATNGGANDSDYQYDSHRIPWRIGLDYCINGTAAAKTYTSKNTGFFAPLAATGVGRIVGIYTTGGTAVTTDYNSMSLLGTATVGGMATGNQAFVDEGYQAVLDMANRNVLDAPKTAGTNGGYSYFNASVGLLTLLTMTGNFNVF